MSSKNLLDKRVLIVDDESDVLDTLEELLPMCRISRAINFEEATELLDKEEFDITILDIMGVKGYELLELAVKKGVIAVMLTANALSIEDTIKSFEQGAAFYVPKEKMGEIVTYLDDILEAKENKTNLWSRWLERFGSYYTQRFGPRWKEHNKKFWENFPYFTP